MELLPDAINILKLLKSYSVSHHMYITYLDYFYLISLYIVISKHHGTDESFLKCVIMLIEDIYKGIV